MGLLRVGREELWSSGADTLPWAILPDSCIAPSDDDSAVIEVGEPGRWSSCLAGLILPDGTGRLVELSTGDGGTRVAPCKSEDLDMKHWAKMPQIGGLKGVSEGLVARVQMGCDPSAVRAMS